MASTAAAVTVPEALRDERVGTSNVTSFRSDSLYGFGDTDGTSTSPATGNGIQPGFLAQRYGLTPLDPPGPATSNSILPQLERAVVEFRGGSATLGDAANRTYGVHTPNATTGQPTSVPLGTGVYESLTTGTTLNAYSSTVSTTGQINAPWTNFQVGGGSGADKAVLPPAVTFFISRVNSTLTVQIGDQTSASAWDHMWSATSSAFTDINGFQLRMATGGTSTWRVTDLRYNGSLLESTIGSGATSTYQADTISGGAFTEREIYLWDKVSGDFTLTGNLFLGWRVSRPSGTTANLQISFLDLPSEPIPEPASWVMLIAGFGLVGASLRRRRIMAA